MQQSFTVGLANAYSVTHSCFTFHTPNNIRRIHNQMIHRMSFAIKPIQYVCQFDDSASQLMFVTCLLLLRVKKIVVKKHTLKIFRRWISEAPGSWASGLLGANTHHKFILIIRAAAPEVQTPSNGCRSDNALTWVYDDGCSVPTYRIRCDTICDIHLNFICTRPYFGVLSRARHVDDGCDFEWFECKSFAERCASGDVGGQHVWLVAHIGKRYMLNVIETARG